MTGSEVRVGKHITAGLRYGLAKDPGRVDWQAFNNMGADSWRAGALEMRMLIAEAKEHYGSRVENPFYHTSINWAPEDDPTEAEMREVAGRYLKHMGLEDNQVLLVAHNDTPYAHVHIMANRVFPPGHPRQFRAWELDLYNGEGRDRTVDKLHNQRTQEFFEGIEQEFGWREVGGKYRGEEKEREGRSPRAWEIHQQKKAKAMAAGFGIEPDEIDGRSVMERAIDVEEALFEAESFREFDQALQEQSLWLDMARNKKGMVITDGRHRIKASSISGQLSGPQLEKRFGGSLKGYVYDREKQLKELDGMGLAVNWRSGMIEEELQTLEMILHQKHKTAESKVQELKDLDQAFSREIKSEYGQFDRKWDEAFENGKSARRAFNKKMTGKDMEIWVQEGQHDLMENPGQFGQVKDSRAITQMSRDLRAMERLSHEFQQYFSEGLSNKDRQALIEQTSLNAKQLVPSIQRVKSEIKQNLREQMDDPDVQRAGERGYNEALTLWRAVSRIQQAYQTIDQSDKQMSPMGRNPALDGKMAEAITVLDGKLEGYYADPTKARLALWDMMWADKTEEIGKIVHNSGAFGVKDGDVSRGEISKALQAPKKIRQEFKGFLDEMSPEEVEGYFRKLPQAMKERPAEQFQALSPGAVTGLELMKASSRWLSRASGTEAGRALFSMSARAVKVSASIAKMLKNPVGGSLSLAKGVMKEAIQQSNGREREKNQELER